MPLLRLVTLTLAILLTAASALAGGNRCRAAQPTFVLVHGAFHGGWVWQQVAKSLAQHGRVYTPTLTGVGERSHLARPDVTLKTHIDDIVQLLRFEDLHHVVLVGHSYAGMVVTGAALQAPERIQQIIYLDAVVPDPGQSFFEAFQFPDQFPPELWLMPSFPPEMFGLVRADHLAWVTPRLTPQPMETFRAPLAFDWAALASIPKAFVHIVKDPSAPDPFLPSKNKAKAMGFACLELEGAHDVMVTSPAETARLLRWLSCQGKHMGPFDGPISCLHATHPDCR